MADVKWIKITTDIFDDEKILLIESLPDAYAIITVWFKLLCLAGKQNNSGVFLMGRMPFTDEMFSTIFRRPLNTIRMALNIFEQFGMIEIVNNTVTIPNWDKHQSLDSYEKKKERDRLYQAERRAAQKRIAEKSSDKSSDVALQIRREEDKNKTDKKRVAVEETPEFSPEDDLLQPCGESGVVYLSSRQVGDLLDRFGLKAFDYYVDRLEDFVIENDAKVKNHYETIIKWATEDSQVRSDVG